MNVDRSTVNETSRRPRARALAGINIWVNTGNTRRMPEHSPGARPGRRNQCRYLGPVSRYYASPPSAFRARWPHNLAQNDGNGSVCPSRDPIADPKRSQVRNPCVDKLGNWERQDRMRYDAIPEIHRPTNPRIGLDRFMLTLLYTYNYTFLTTLFHLEIFST